MWIITKDHVESGRRVGVGPLDMRESHNGFHFRMYDDDGNLYYEGYSLCDSDFGPLDDFGQPNAGATEIRYRNRKTGKYERL